MRNKILFVLPSLTAGGAERVILNIMNHLSFDKFQLYLLVLKKENFCYNNYLNDQIKVIQVDSKLKLRFAFIPIIKYVREIKPDSVFIGMGLLNVLMSFFIPFFKEYKWFCRETIMIKNRGVRPLEMLAYKYFYRFYDRIIAQSDIMKDDLVACFGLSPYKVKVIPNPLDIDHIVNSMGAEPEVIFNKQCKNIVACGRLTYQKGFDLLIDSFAYLEDSENIHLTIIGTGNVRDSQNQETLLREKVLEYKMSHKITLSGHINNVYAIIKQADLFILSSRFEGFPNVVLEALCCGIPVIANEDVSGIDTILEDGVNGLLFSYHDSKRSLNNTILKAKLKSWDTECIRQSVEGYNVVNIVQSYDKLFQ